ncbi:MAG: sulfurtransferase [Sedimentisphaeraceae bacterium JB056]
MRDIGEKTYLSLLGILFFITLGIFEAECGEKTNPDNIPKLVSVDWLAENLGVEDIVVIDLSKTPSYNKSHIPGSLSLNVESFRGNIEGFGPLLLPSDILAKHYSLMGIQASDMIVFVYGDKIYDATLASMSCQRLGHESFCILDGGFNKWVERGMVVDQRLATAQQSEYKACDTEEVTVDYQEVFSALDNPQIVIIDVRPSDYYNAVKSDEARAGHIPGAVNRPIGEDFDESLGYPVFKRTKQLSSEYSDIIPSKDSTVIVHCRTGLQASQTFFVLKYLLGYPKVLWYDGSWSQWAAVEQLPIEKP